MSTIKDVARLAGVGVGTASRALSGKGSVSDDAADRELADVVVVRRVADDHLERALGVAGGARDLLHDGVEEHRREFEILEAGDLGLDVARHQGDFIALLEDVDPKTAYLGQGDGEVHLQLPLELLLLLAVHDGVGYSGHLAGFERRFTERTQAAVELGARGGAGRQIEVGAILFGQHL